MLEYPLSLFDFNLAYLRLQVEDIPDDNFSLAAFPGGKTPRWLLGHLAVCNDYGLQLLGHDKTCSEEWHRSFGPGSDPTRSEVQPNKAELLAAMERGASAFKEAARSATPEQLAAKHRVPMKQLVRHTPTVGELVAHLLSTHVATHLGQLSVWRRQQGLAEVF
jgi:hypothetical protein